VKINEVHRLALVDNLWKIISLRKGFFLIFPVFSMKIKVFKSG